MLSARRSSASWRQTMMGRGKQTILWLNVSISWKLQKIHPKLLFMTNRKLHMRFQLTPRLMTLDDVELYKFEFSVNFSGFRRFWTQQQQNEWRYTSIVSDNVVSTSNWSNFGMLSRQAGLSAIVGLSCCHHVWRKEKLINFIFLNCATTWRRSSIY